MIPEATQSIQERTLTAKKPFWPRELLLGLMLPLIGIQLMVWIAYLPIGLHGFADLRSFYTGAYMTRTGHAHEIYDPEKLQEFERKLVPLEQIFLQPMDHPAYEEILFLPLSFLIES